MNYCQAITVYVSAQAVEYPKMLRELHLMHCGQSDAPEHPTTEHLEAVWALSKSHQGTVVLELQNTGKMRPLEIYLNGVVYDVVPRKA